MIPITVTGPHPTPHPQAGSGGGGVSPNFLLQEDGSSQFLLESGAGSIILEM